MERIDLLSFTCVFGMFFGYLWVTFNSPIAFGDEGFYSSMGKWIAEHMEFPKYYPLWGTEHLKTPSVRVPMGFANSALFYFLFGEAGIKLMTPLFAMLGALVIYVVFRKMEKPYLGFFASLAFISLPGVVKYGVLNYPENQMIFYVICSLAFFFLWKTEGKALHLLLSGIFFSLAVLSDISAAFLLVVYAVYALWEAVKERKISFEDYALLIAGAALVALPWILRNLVLFGSPCFAFFSSKSCSPVQDFEGIGFKVHTQRPEISTGAGILKFGIAQYLRFGYGLAGFLAIFGIMIVARQRSWRSAFFLSWLLVFLAANVYLALPNPRVEELLRYTLFSTPLIAIFVAYFLDELRKISEIERLEKHVLYLLFAAIFGFSLLSFSGTYYARFARGAGIERILFGELMVAIPALWISLQAFYRKRKNYLLAIPLIISVCAVIFYGIAEITNMYFVKHNLDSLVDACSWVRENLPQNATLTLIYAHPAEYNCYRKTTAIQGLPDGDAIRLFANDTSYELLKKWGIEYIFIEGYTIVPDSAYHGEALPYSFVKYVESSGHFEKVFDNRDKFGNAGVRIYRVK